MSRGYNIPKGSPDIERSTLMRGNRVIEYFLRKFHRKI